MTQKNLYNIPLLMRFTRVGGGVNEKCIEVDGIGIFVSYNEKKELAPENIRRHLIGSKTTYCFVEAKTIKEAKKIFYREWEGASVGTRAKALWINSKKRIVKEKACKYRHKDKYYQYACGEIDENTGNGEFGGCCIEGFDTDDLTFCPYNKNREED